FRAALLLLIGPGVGFNIDRIACRAQMPRSVVAACTRRLFDNGVWHPDGPVYTWQAPDDRLFWSDVGVAEGRLCRRTDRLGRIEWADAGEWHKAYDFGGPKVPSLSVDYLSQTDADRGSGGEPHAEIEVDLEDSARPVLTWVVGEPIERELAPLKTNPVESNTWLGTAARQELFPGAAWLI
ncbi:MAG: hypothetical protein ACREMA_10090, partial [Longimicrobiales bacterium]